MMKRGLQQICMASLPKCGWATISPVYKLQYFTFFISCFIVIVIVYNYTFEEPNGKTACSGHILRLTQVKGVIFTNLLIKKIYHRLPQH